MKVSVYSVYDTSLDDYEHILNNILDIQLKVSDGKICYQLLSACGHTFLYDTSDFLLVVSYGFTC